MNKYRASTAKRRSPKQRLSDSAQEGSRPGHEKVLCLKTLPCFSPPPPPPSPPPSLSFHSHLAHILSTLPKDTGNFLTPWTEESENQSVHRDSLAGLAEGVPGAPSTLLPPHHSTHAPLISLRSCSGQLPLLTHHPVWMAPHLGRAPFQAHTASSIGEGALPMHLQKLMLTFVRRLLPLDSNSLPRSLPRDAGLQRRHAINHRRNHRE